MFIQSVVIVGALAGTASAAVASTFTAPAPAPTSESPFYVGASNGTITDGPNVPGKVFDRFIQIWIENTDYATAASSPVFQNLSSKGITLSSYYGVTHPSEPNYLASVGGDFWGLASDQFESVPSNISTIVDGFGGFNFTNPDNYTYYVRKHNPLVIYDSVAKNMTRVGRVRNFNDFAVDVRVPVFLFSQWIFITPNLRKYVVIV